MAKCVCETSISKEELDKLVEIYETEDFIKDDPIQFPHRFFDKKDIEIAGFIASILAYGRREVFIKKLDQLFDIAQNEPYNFILNFEPEILADFNYRFGKTEDFCRIFTIMRKLYMEDGGLEELFKYSYQNCDNLFKPVCDYFYSRVKGSVAQGFYFMLPNPEKGGAMKRMSMFLRWMVRKGPVDLGVWNFIHPSKLFIPLDTHVARISREVGLLKRNANDFKAVTELTESLRKLDPIDPVKYDFALFGYGVNNKLVK